MTLCNRSSSPRQPIHVRAVRRVQLGVQLLHLALQLSNALVQLLLAFARCKLPLQRRWHVRVRGQSGAARRCRVHDSGALCTRCTRKTPNCIDWCGHMLLACCTALGAATPQPANRCTGAPACCPPTGCQNCLPALAAVTRFKHLCTHRRAACLQSGVIPCQLIQDVNPAVNRLQD